MATMLRMALLRYIFGGEYDGYDDDGDGAYGDACGADAAVDGTDDVAAYGEADAAAAPHDDDCVTCSDYES